MGFGFQALEVQGPQKSGLAESEEKLNSGNTGRYFRRTKVQTGKRIRNGMSCLFSLQTYGQF